MNAYNPNAAATSFVLYSLSAEIKQHWEELQGMDENRVIHLTKSLKEAVIEWRRYLDLQHVWNMGEH